MKLSFFAPLAIAAAVTLLGCQQLEQDLGGGSGGSAGVDAGPLGSVCCGVGSCADGLDCCLTATNACDSDYECCGGLCNSGMCTASGVTSCIAALGSRCTSKETCACATDDDCCQENTGAVCAASSVTSEGKRCCLTTGTPCGGDGDCCSQTCDPTALTCGLSTEKVRDSSTRMAGSSTGIGS